jgi:predicted RNA methylase
VHPTPKNLEMLLYLIKLSGGDRIGDICFGSGGVAIACQILGLDFWGAEFCPEAVEITKARRAFWGGLSLSAIEAFRLTGEVPARAPVDVRQRSLF